MKLSEIQPIQNKPALFIKEKKILVIADLHIGIESELEEKGISAASQTEQMTKELLSLIKKYKAEDVILLGDIKHNIPKTLVKERIDIRNFFKRIVDKATIHIIPGNHDGNIKWFLPKDCKIHSADGLIIENIGFIHGHKWPKEEIFSCDQIIMAHTHPTFMFTDRLNHKSFEFCWIKTNFNMTKLKQKYNTTKNPELLVVPAFNLLCGGIAVNKQGIQGPIGKIVSMKNIEVYLVDGTVLGKINCIN